MRNFDAFANIGEHRGMFADDVTRPDGCETNGARHALPGVAFAGIDSAVF